MAKYAGAGVRDASGNNPFPIANGPRSATYPAVNAGAPVNPSAASGANITFDVPARAIYIGEAGALNVTLLDGTNKLFSALAAGSILDVQALGTVTTNNTVLLINPLF